MVASAQADVLTQVPAMSDPARLATAERDVITAELRLLGSRLAPDLDTLRLEDLLMPRLAALQPRRARAVRHDVAVLPDDATAPCPHIGRISVSSNRCSMTEGSISRCAALMISLRSSITRSAARRACIDRCSRTRTTTARSPQPTTFTSTRSTSSRSPTLGGSTPTFSVKSTNGSSH